MDLKGKIDVVVELEKNKTSIANKRKAPLKSEISQQLKLLQEKFNALEDENKQNVETIKNLELKLKGMEEKRPLKDGKMTIKHSVPVQTEEILLCHKCDYVAEDIIELDGHTYSDHAPEEYLHCRFCENAFDSLRELMLHRKKHHLNRVNVCWDYSNGVCTYGESDCWFKHSTAVETASRGLTRSNCNICDETFTSRSELMYHNKRKHTKQVPLCNKNINGTCWFGNNNCWFIHEEVNESEKVRKDEELTKDNEVIEKDEVVQRLFQMMEKLTERMFQIEKKDEE